MRSKLLLNGFMASALILPLCAFADMQGTVENAGQSAKTFIKDSVITAKIKTNLAKENFSSTSDLKVETDAQGYVWLHGSAESDAEAARAVEIARQTEGVTAVKSDIIVKRKPQ